MKDNSHVQSLTSLKGLFIFLIVLHNTLSLNDLFTTIPGTAFIREFGGLLGNSVFFMISGFLISQRYRLTISQRSIAFGSFMLRRLKKLYPIYLITNIAAMIVRFFAYGISALPIRSTVFTFLLQSGGGLSDQSPYNAPTWFLSTLFVCYVIYYFITYHANSPTAYRCYVVFMIIIGYALLELNIEDIPFSYVANGTAYSNFFMGCLLTELLPTVQQKHKPIIQIPALIVLLGAFLLCFKYGINIVSGRFETACTFFFVPITLYLALTDGFCSTILSVKPLVYWGKLSSSMFFWHLVVYLPMSIFFFGNNIQPVQYLIYMVTLIGVCILSYNCIERKL